MSKPTPSRVRVDGPLKPYAHGFCRELSGLGYSSSPAAGHLQLMAHLSRWLVDRGLESGELTDFRVEQFVASRRAAGRVHRRLTLRGMSPLLGYLRELGVIPPPESEAAAGPLEELLEEFTGFRVDERGLAVPTVANYRRVAKAFLAACACRPGSDQLQVGDLVAEDGAGSRYRPRRGCRSGCG